MPRKKAVKRAPDKISTLVSVEQADPTSVEALQSKIADLQSKLTAEREKRSDAEEKLLQQAEAQVQFATDQEIPTGKTRMVRLFDKNKIVGYKDDANGRPILRPQFKTVKVPTYYLKILLPPSGGDKVITNGEEFYHGTVYEMDINTVRDMKSRMFNSWRHEQEIRGRDENAYRPKQNPHLSPRGVQRA